MCSVARARVSRGVKKRVQDLRAVREREIKLLYVARLEGLALREHERDCGVGSWCGCGADQHNVLVRDIATKLRERLK